MITLAKRAGYCFGVRRAVQMAEDNAAPDNLLYAAGPLIHNRHVIEDLRKGGIITANSLEEIPDGARVIIRAHGVPPTDITYLKKKGCTILDATCPFVARIHKIVEEESEKGRAVLIFGKHGHPEVVGIAARCKTPLIAETEEDLKEILQKHANSPLSVVCQTTFQKEICLKFVNIVKNTCNSPQIFDTICVATELRQSEAHSLALRSDFAVVIGDPSSSNSQSLYRLCQNYCPKVQFVQDAEELDLTGLTQARHAFVTAGASTPDRIIEEVYRNMTDEIKTTSAESFEELLEQSLKTLHTGEKVTGVVTAINATDITVDLGVKQAGYIPTTELSDDPTYVVADNIHVGDEVEAFVVRVNDVEGWIMLSKKRLDAVKNWEVLEAAVESKEAMDGIIVDQNKGGVVALVKGIRVFIPASQTGLPREASFDSMMKTTQKLRITEVNTQRHRVVGSIKALLNESRKEAQAKIWETIEVGTVYQGVVKSFTSYGAFVDIGGVDGMVHISELSWGRVKHPSDVLTIGQEVEVYVIALDAEKKKISLGYRKAQDNPWTKFTTTYAEGDVANVKIVKFMPFGAFAEVLPGVDGLIHISQIADRRIGKPEEVLQVGQMVDAKIIGIDEDKKKISLSIRALLTGEEAPAEEAAE
jgi:4-hydroxy-3-methylbut-2-enyl diphosphate reductase